MSVINKIKSKNEQKNRHKLIPKRTNLYVNTKIYTINKIIEAIGRGLEELTDTSSHGEERDERDIRTLRKVDEKRCCLFFVTFQADSSTRRSIANPNR